MNYNLGPEIRTFEEKQRLRWMYASADATQPQPQPQPTNGRPLQLKITAGPPDIVKKLSVILPRVTWTGDSPENIQFFGDKTDTDNVQYFLAQCDWELVLSNGEQNFSRGQRQGPGQGHEQGLRAALIDGVLKHVFA